MSSTLLWCCLFFHFYSVCNFENLSILDLALSGVKGLRLVVECVLNCFCHFSRILESRSGSEDESDSESETESDEHSKSESESQSANTGACCWSLTFASV